MSSTNDRGLVVFGGTFDPVHNGHIECALALQASLGGESLVLVPSRTPPHRGEPSASAEDRYNMVQAATNNLPGIVVDNRELMRDGPSYIYETLASFRRDIGDLKPLIFAMGFDSFVTLPNWHRWQELCELAHLVVLNRGVVPDSEPVRLQRWVQERLLTGPMDLMKTPAGHVCRLSLVDIPISATNIRARIRAGEDIKSLVPVEVDRYIRQHQLYSGSKSP